MKRRFSILLHLFFLLALSACGITAPSPMPSLTPTLTLTPSPTVAAKTGWSAEERLEILDNVWQTVNDEYFDPTFGDKDWQAIGAEYRQKLETVQDDKTFWRGVVLPMLFELGASHLVALPPGYGNQIDVMTFATGSLGMDVRLLDGLAVVTRVDQGSPADQAGLRPGFVVTSVNGRTWEDIAAESLLTPPYNASNKLASKVKGLRSLLYGEKGSPAVVAYLDAQDQPGKVTLQYGPRSIGVCGEIDPALPPGCADLEVKRLENGFGYLRFSGFLSPVLDGVRQAIRDLHDTPALIIDLRGNPGGVFFVRKAIASQLVGTPDLFLRYRYRDHLEEVYLDPVPDAYQGKVVILVDEHSASSAEEFSGSLQALGRATIVGGQTQGNCLVAEIEALPQGVVMMIPVAQGQTIDGRILEYNGVVPDIAVTLDRLQLLQGIDAQLQAAIQYIKKDQ
jgi:carboxyl-terminal processing protease